MASPTTTSARPPEAEASHSSLNEPSMEDILASIRRIIAEDQSNNLGRSGLGGLTRRAQPAAPPPVPEPLPQAETSAVEPQAHELAEPDSHAGHHGDPLQGAYHEAAEIHGDPSEPPPIVSEVEVPVYAGAAVEAHEQEPRGLIHEQGFATALSEDGSEPLMSATTGASITSSFQTLAESVVLQDPGLIERVMRESMRPLLKAWLDDHLPSIVERLVRAEIERVARGGRARNA